MRREVTEPPYLDIELPAGARFSQPLPAGHNAFVYVYPGQHNTGGFDLYTTSGGADTSGNKINNWGNGTAQ